MLESKNTKKQGDIGLGASIGWFTKQGYTVSIPLTDSQAYDPVVDIEDVLYKVQVKTTKSKSPSGSYVVRLLTCGGNTSRYTVKHFDNTLVDYVFILSNDGCMYFIPALEIISINSLTLNEELDKYKVT